MFTQYCDSKLPEGVVMEVLDMVGSIQVLMILKVKQAVIAWNFSLDNLLFQVSHLTIVTVPNIEC